MKKNLIAVLVFLILSESLSAQNIAATNRLLDSIFKPFNNKNSPGYAITVIKDGKTITKKDYGMASIEFGVPFAHNTVVRIPYSEGREFVSIAAAIMEQQGLLTLRDKVRKYFPKLPAWSEPVTIQDLLNHSSGFCDEWATLVLTQAEMANRLDRSQFMDFLYNQPDPQVEPGKGYMYSNSDFGLLRLILEKVCGKNLSVYMSEKIFTPIGMNQTKLGTNKEEVIPNYAFSYDHNGAGKYTVWMRDKTSPGGNYWMLTSAADLEKWAKALADKNSAIAKATQRLKQNARPIPVLKGINYPFGNKIKLSGNYEVITHEGVSGYSWLTQVPAAGISIICLGNEHAPYADKMDVATEFLLYGKANKISLRKFSSTPVPISTAELQKYVGIYRELSPTGFSSAIERKSYTEMKVIDDSLFWQYSKEDLFPLVYVGNGIFKDPDYANWVVFTQPHPDSPMRAEAHKQHGIQNIYYWKKDTAFRHIYSKEFLNKLTGIYYSKHLDFYWRIILDEKGKLILKRPTISDKQIEPGYDDEFDLAIQFHTDDETTGWIKFYFDDKEEPVYLNVRHGRLMHHRFDKVK